MDFHFCVVSALFGFIGLFLLAFNIQKVFIFSDHHLFSFVTNVDKYFWGLISFCLNHITQILNPSSFFFFVSVCISKRYEVLWYIDV